MLKHEGGCFRCITVGVYFFSFKHQIQCSQLRDADVANVALSSPENKWTSQLPRETNEAVYSFFYKRRDIAEAAVLKDKFVDMPTEAAKQELKAAEERMSEETNQYDDEYADENERTSALYSSLKPELDSRGFVSSHIEATHKFLFDKSCCYISGGADIVVSNPHGILVLDVREGYLDDSTEEGELKGVSVSETKLKSNTGDLNQVIGEGVMFASRYLFKVITAQNVDPADIVAIKCYLVWMTFSSTIRFYVLKAEFNISRYTLVPKGAIVYHASQPKRLGQYLNLILQKLSH